MKNLWILILFILPCNVLAQNKAQSSLSSVDSVEVELSQDTVPSLLYQFYFGNLDSLANAPYRIKDIELDPDYYQLFVPMTYYSAPMNQATRMNWEFEEPFPASDNRAADLLSFDKERYQKSERANKQVNKYLLNFYVNHPEMVTNHEGQIMSRKTFREDVEVKISPKASVIELFKPETAEVNVEADMVIRKPNFWTTGGNGSLQFTQNYVSSNWYKGGESANSLLGYVQLFANYNDKEKVQFENMFEAKVGFNTVSSDTVRKYRINTDVLRIYSKLGLQAAKNWYYTGSLEINSQFFNNYKSNSDDIVSSFLAPVNVIASIGMDFKQKKKKYNLSVFISPLAYTLRYVGNNKVDETKFGIKEGDKSAHDFGSKLQSNLTWQIIPSVSLTSRLYYFTSYERVEAEWENTFDFALNRYLSTKLFIHARFDDGAKKVEGKSYFQLKELLSFGINYKW